MSLQKAKRIIKTGKEFLGTPYVFGAESGRTDRFDCSSFVQYVYGAHGIILPRTSRQQYLIGKPVLLSSVRRGDLVFFTTPKRTNHKEIHKIGHVAIFIGNNSILHTSRIEKKVSIASLDPYWRKKLIGVRRVVG
ncbi:C40 family peptidase [Sutcliffiella horikoshii]|uniref:C40 family peptidase n=1 Tax=Sutcliffiella horikoshii TaxID=79883 RepID=UPI001CFDCE7F|nr:C40 family peptidase [Sutcliffiella horikoshii]